MDDIIIGRRHVSVASIEGLDPNGLSGYKTQIAIGNKTQVFKKAGTIPEANGNSTVFTLLPSETKDLAPGNYNVEVNIWKENDAETIWTPIKDTVKVVQGLVTDPTAL